ncbi:hypothetical protein Fmac_025418 [Flemingia macrophylla]|uniref:Retrotransposon gag domain-containing protein n=1 Tax=Flemingia macrophylla TaxID=520843 RepID=A0ABD1LTW1_9FABA
MTIPLTPTYFKSPFFTLPTPLKGLCDRVAIYRANNKGSSSDECDNCHTIYKGRSCDGCINDHNFVFAAVCATSLATIAKFAHNLGGGVREGVLQETTSSSGIRAWFFHQSRKISLAILSFQGTTIIWLLAQARDRNELKNALRRRHIPPYHTRELMDKLQCLRHKSIFVKEYRQKMELYMLRANIREHEDTTVALEGRVVKGGAWSDGSGKRRGTLGWRRMVGHAKVEAAWRRRCTEAEAEVPGGGRTLRRRRRRKRTKAEAEAGEGKNALRLRHAKAELPKGGSGGTQRQRWRWKRR